MTYAILEDRIYASMEIDEETVRKANYVKDKHGLSWPSASSAESFYNLVEQGTTVKYALFAVELATGEKAYENWYMQGWQHANNTASWGQTKEPKKKLPYYQGKRRF